MIISLAAEHTSSELLVLLWRSRPAVAAGCSVVGFKCVGRVVQTTAGKRITHPRSMPERAHPRTLPSPRRSRRPAWVMAAADTAPGIAEPATPVLRAAAQHRLHSLAGRRQCGSPATEADRNRIEVMGV